MSGCHLLNLSLRRLPASADESVYINLADSGGWEVYDVEFSRLIPD